jgi:hypothetical protein
MKDLAETHEIDPEQTSEEEVVPLTEWKNAPSVTDLKQNLTDSQSSHDTQKSKVGVWLDNLNVTGAAKPNTPKGSSKIQPKLIRKQAEWRYAALSEPFLSTRDIFNVSPITWEDKRGAEQNELLLNNQMNTKINKVRFIDEYVRGAVNEGTAIVRVGWDFQEEKETVKVPIVLFTQDDSLFPLHEELARMQEENPTGYLAEVPEELQQAHELSMRDGVPYKPTINGERDEEITKTVRNQPTVEVCDYRNIIVDPSCMGDLEKAGFVIYSFESAIAELEKEGRYKNLDKVNIENNSVLNDPDHKSDKDDNFNFVDKPRKRVVVYEYWGYWDIDGNGVIQPIVASWIGDTFIRMEMNPYPDKKIPFIAVQYLPVKRSVFGEPDGHLLEDNQKVVGAVTRGMIDIMGKSANGQTGVRKDALDVTNRRKFEQGRDYEFNPTSDPRQAIYTHTYPEIPASAQFMLQLTNMDAESMTGVKAFSGSDGISGAGLGEVAAGVRGALDAASKRELGILRRLADGIVQIGRKFISMNAVFLEEEEVVRVTNDEFVPINRDDLAGNFDLHLSISTAEEDNAKAQELAFMLQTTAQSSDPEEVRMLRAEIARLRKMPALAKRIEEFQPQVDEFTKRKQDLELELLQAKIDRERGQTLENHAEANLDNARADTERTKQGNIQSDTDQKNLNFVEQESGVTQERDLQKQGAQAEAQGELKLLDEHINNKKDSREQLRNYLKTSEK